MKTAGTAAPIPVAARELTAARGDDTVLFAKTKEATEGACSYQCARRPHGGVR